MILIILCLIVSTAITTGCAIRTIAIPAHRWPWCVAGLGWLGKFPSNDWGQIRLRASSWMGRLCEVSIEGGIILGIRKIKE